MPRFQVSFIGSWFDPPKAKETAFAMIENGADMMYAERFRRVGRSTRARRSGNWQRDRHAVRLSGHRSGVGALWHFEPTTAGGACSRLLMATSRPPIMGCIPI